MHSNMNVKYVLVFVGCIIICCLY